MRSTSISRQSSMVAELKALRREYAAAQQRCSVTIGALHARNAELEAEVLRLRAAVAARDSALQWAKDDRVRLLATLPGLPARLTLLGRMEALADKVQHVLRQLLRLQAQVRGQTREQAQSASLQGGGAPAKAVDQAGFEWASGEVSAGAHAAPAHTPPVASAGRHAWRAEADWDDDGAALEERLDEADLVICQTGCLSHAAYWRMQDHCRRHNKPCVLVEQPDAVRVIRIHQRGESVVPDTMPGPSCSDTDAEAGRMLDTTMSTITIENVDASGADGAPVVRPPIFRPDEH